MSEPTGTLKTCRSCGEAKPLADFPTRDAGHMARCKPCMAAVRRARRSTEAGSASYKESLRKWKLAQFGITPQQYELLLAAQRGVCAICAEACATGRRLTVDHDHLTGRVRALLCTACNRQLGIFEAFLARGAQYLDKYGDGNPLLAGEGAHAPIPGMRDKVGASNVSAKLTDGQVSEIRRRYAAGGVTQRQLAAEYCISQINISRIVRNQRWSHEQECPKPFGAPGQAVT